jgi:hypothetical protein
MPTRNEVELLCYSPRFKFFAIVRTYLEFGGAATTFTKTEMEAANFMQHDFIVRSFVQIETMRML